MRPVSPTASRVASASQRWTANRRQVWRRSPGRCPTSPSDRKIREELFEQLRPKHHRYCARRTGSVIDGEDVVQEALLKALEALPRAGTLANPEGWLFRIAHNTALDFSRRPARRQAAFPQDT